MSAIQVTLLASAATALLGLAAYAIGKRVRRDRPTLGTTNVDESRGTSSEIAMASPDHVRVDGGQDIVFSIPDPRNPSGQVLVEVVPAADAELLARPDSKLSVGELPTYKHAYDAIANSIPAAADTARRALEAGDLMRIVGPEEVRRGLAEGALELVSRNGSKLGTVKDTGSGLFAGQLELRPVQGIDPGAAALGVFQAMAVISGQYYMHRIDSKLEEMQRSLTRIERIVKAQTYSKLDHATSVSNRIVESVKDGLVPTDNDLEELRGAERDASMAFSEARDHLRSSSDEWAAVFQRSVTEKPSKLKDLASDFVPFVELLVRHEKREKRKEFHEAVRKACESREGDVAVVLYAAALQAKITLMRAMIEASLDPSKSFHWEKEYQRTRERLLHEVREALAPLRPLGHTSESLIDERLGGLLWHRTSELKASMKELRSHIVAAERQIDQPTVFPTLPAGSLATPTVIEMRKSAQGEIEVAVALIEPSKTTKTGARV